jgi:hypothetical protein
MKKLIQTLAQWLGFSKKEPSITKPTWSNLVRVMPGHRLFRYDKVTKAWDEMDIADKEHVLHYGNNHISIKMQPAHEYVTALNIENAKRHLDKKMAQSVLVQKAKTRFP